LVAGGPGSASADVVAATAHRSRRSDRRYNRAFGRSANEPGDRLWRDDGLYDLFVEIDHNTKPRIAGRGSAVFIHLARPGFAPTAGCIALRLPDLQKLVSRMSLKTRITIHS
jgi:L,D-peptidoglycan transpeptidase YkuD (ErfK/YbiS/YcfS/YnhG family)